MRRWRAMAAVAAAALLAGLPAPSPAAAATVAFDGSGVGQIPDGPGGPGFDCGVAGAPLVITFDVGGMSGTLTDVALTITGTHTWIGDMGVTLIAPDDTAHVIFSRLLATAATGGSADGACGEPIDFSGSYTFTDQASASFAATAATATGFRVPPGSYRTATAGGVAGGSQDSSMTPAFANAQLNGSWTLQVVDWNEGDVGSVSAASLTLTTTTTTLSSQASPLSAVVGEALGDTATLIGVGESEDDGSLTFELFGPDDSSCAGRAVFTSTVDVAGDGDYVSAPFTPTDRGVYRWVVSYTGDSDNDPAATMCGDPNQTVTVTAAAPGLALTKTAGGITDIDGNGADPGDTITYTFTVTNTGNVTLTGVAVDDPLVGGAVPCGTAPLAPGQARGCDPAVYTLADGDLDSTVVNTATATATAGAAGAVQASAAVSTPIPPACAAPPASEPQAISDEPVETSEVPLSAQPPTTTESTEPPATTEQPASTDAPLPTSEQPTDTTEEPAPTSEATTPVTAPTITSENTVTVAASIAPLGFAAAHPRQLDPCNLPPTTTTTPSPPATTAIPTPTAADGGASGGGSEGPAGLLPVTGTSPIATLLAAFGLVTAGLAVAAAGRLRHGIGHSPNTRPTWVDSLHVTSASDRRPAVPADGQDLGLLPVTPPRRTVAKAVLGVEHKDEN